MQIITQNKIGSITITEDIIRNSVSSYASFNPNYKLVHLQINKNEAERFVFMLYFTTTKYTKIVDEVDALITFVQKQIRNNLQLFGFIIIAQISK
ncbi:MAG: hypothetical protein LBD63_01685 [Mycoplasmataceae bacterium]|jgi:hypothetical protein|nr:hypothetical protein [Mycoplasmataceae bacterium]